MPTRAVVTPLPVVYACADCPSSAVARAVVRMLDGRGLAEAASAAGDSATEISRAKSRFPVVAVDGCREACARRWLEQHGVTPQRHFVLGEGEDVGHAVERIADGLVSAA